MKKSRKPNPRIVRLIEFCGQAKKWVCPKCGCHADISDGRWRWNGKEWEHSHDYPLGHITGKWEPVTTANVLGKPVDPK